MKQCKHHVNKTLMTDNARDLSFSEKWTCIVIVTSDVLIPDYQDTFQWQFQSSTCKKCVEMGDHLFKIGLFSIGLADTYNQVGHIVHHAGFKQVLKRALLSLLIFNQISSKSEGSFTFFIPIIISRRITSASFRPVNSIKRWTFFSVLSSSLVDQVFLLNRNHC